MAINKLNYHFNNKGNIQQGDRILNKDTFQGMANKTDELVDFANSIIEQGSNSNGEYIKFSNGIMICYLSFSMTITGKEWTQWGNIYLHTINTGIPSFPQKFISKPKITITSTETAAMIGCCSCNNTGIDYIALLRGIVIETANHSFSAIAIGKWK